MTTYRCYFMSGEHVPVLEILECDEDADVIFKAAALLNSKPGHQGIEIWKDARLVARVPRRPSSLQRPLPDGALGIIAGAGKKGRG